MTKTTLIITALLLIFPYQTVYGEDFGNHKIYKVTFYNLEPALQQQDSTSVPGKLSPLMITGQTTDVLNNEYQGRVPWGETDSRSRGMALSAEFEATDRISLQGAFGVTSNLWPPDGVAYDNNSSWEANLGFIYRLVDDLAYELHFGYMDTGNLFTNQSVYSDIDSIIMISNRLTLSF